VRTIKSILFKSRRARKANRHELNPEERQVGKDNFQDAIGA